MAGKLRITGGSLSRRLIQVPKAADQGLVRPTTDMVRAAVFSSLFDRVTNAKVLDLFAGSGSHGFEAISRGAQQVVFVEKDQATAECISNNIKSLKVDNLCELKVADASLFVKQHKPDIFNIVFVDPPYGHVLEDEFWKNLLNLIEVHSVIIFRCHIKAGFVVPSHYTTVRYKTYGSMGVWFLKATE